MRGVTKYGVQIYLDEDELELLVNLLIGDPVEDQARLDALGKKLVGTLTQIWALNHSSTGGSGR